MRFFLIFCLSLLVLNTYSQNFTFADSLRGNLTSLRTCYDVFYYDLNLTVDDKNKQLVKYALKSKFGLILGSTESQGIAINELMATNLPLFVIDKNINNYENIKLYGTTVPYWSSECGEKILDLNDFKMSFQRFLKNYESNTYKPNNLINEKLSFEKFIENIQLEFLKF